MKTSFYFLIWIAIYPLLALIPGAAIQNYSFLVALLIVFGLSYLLQRTMMPTLRYEHALTAVTTLDRLYYGNVKAIRTQLLHAMLIENLSAVYFAATTLILVMMIIRGSFGENIAALVIFVFMTIGAFNRAARLTKANSEIRRNPTPEQCILTVQEVYGLNYTEYYNTRLGRPLKDMLPPRPKHFKLYLVTSLVIAAICALLGGAMAIIGALEMVLSPLREAFAGGIINMLYGTLALYFGVRDFITTHRQLRQDRHVKD